MTVTVREARPDEYPAIGAATVAAYTGFDGASDDAEYMQELRDVARRASSCPIYVAVDDGTGEVLGGAMYVPGPGSPWAEQERDDEAGIRMLAVAPAAQGRGVGSALLRALMDRARTEGRRGMSLLTLDSMTVAHRLYVRAGFRRDPARDWEVHPDLILRSYALSFADLDTRAAGSHGGSAGTATRDEPS